MRAYVNRYAFTDLGPAMIWTREKISTAKARKIFAKHGLEVERFVPNWAHFLGWAHIIEILVEPVGVGESQEPIVLAGCVGKAA